LAAARVAILELLARSKATIANLSAINLSDNQVGFACFSHKQYLALPEMNSSEPRQSRIIFFSARYSTRFFSSEDK
jgi:hypothetical protein